jgi:hypothetical protein
MMHNDGSLRIPPTAKKTTNERALSQSASWPYSYHSTDVTSSFS